MTIQLPNCPLCGEVMELVDETSITQFQSQQIFFLLCPQRPICGWCSPTRSTLREAIDITNEIILAIQMMRTVKSYTPGNTASTHETQRLS